jgi:four helix bundle protein
MTKDELKRRTRLFALDVIRLVELLPRSRTTEVLGKQLLRSGTSVGANYRAACRAKSSADFVSKMGIVEEEADEAIYWMELLVARPNRIGSLDAYGVTGGISMTQGVRRGLAPIGSPGGSVLGPRSVSGRT